MTMYYYYNYYRIFLLIDFYVLAIISYLAPSTPIPSSTPTRGKCPVDRFDLHVCRFPFVLAK